VSDNRALILDQFTRQAGPFASAPGIRDGRSLRLVVEATGAGPTDRTLDVACGPGLLACAFAEVVAHATGIDLVPAMIAQAEARQAELGLANVSWRVGDVQPLPYDDASFDVVTCRYAFHHFPHPGAVLAEMARVCRPGGRVAVVDVAASPDPAKAASFNEMERRRDPSHVRALPLDELTSLFGDARLPAPVLTTYLLESELEGLLSRSFPDPGDEERVREAIVGTLDDDRLGIPARRHGDRVVLGYPIAVLTTTVPRPNERPPSPGSPGVARCVR
jgi:SAM-dependent methyltransferase